MRKLAALLLALAAVCSCTAISSIIHDDQVVAKVGKYKLYKSQVEKIIPEMAAPEDSANMAMQYINSWATELLYLEVAQKQLSKTDMDVTSELEDYRRSLIRYRYEQRYINERMDTLVTEEQIQEYYDTHKESFVLERPIFKVRFVDVMNDSPGKDAILKMMSSSEYSVLDRADSLAVTSALRYFDNSDTWMDAIVLAREFGTDYKTMMAGFDGRFIRIEEPGRGDLKAAYVCDVQYSGVAPVEHCEGLIRDYILSARKHALLEGLERDLLTDALDRNDFVIY